jgi:D-alanine-D-alanine ligase
VVEDEEDMREVIAYNLDRQGHSVLRAQNGEAALALLAEQIPELEEIHGCFGFPVFVKPRRQGSSIGAGRADDQAELLARCEEAARFDASMVVERFVAGREITVGVLDGRALGALEIVPRSGVYDYRSKYQSGQTDYHFPARLRPTRYQGILRIAERAVYALGVSGAVRVDMLAADGENEYVLEVNTLPGMTPTSLLPKIAKGVGYDFGDLCEAILSRASLGVRRTDQKPEVVTASSVVSAAVSAASR